MVNPEANITLLSVAVSTLLWIFFPHRLFIGALMLISLCAFGVMVFNIGKPLYGALLILGGMMAFGLTVLEISSRRK